jgi:glycerophosphoryl diester phosphodiesterase
MRNGIARKAAGLLSVLMICVLLVGAVFPLEVHAAAKRKKAKTKYTLVVHNINSNTVLRKGQYYQISCEAYKTKKGVTTPTKVKFKSSKKKVASVSKKGVIKAKKKGKTKITIYCKSKKSKKKKVTVRVGTPVSWISVSGAPTLRTGISSKFYASVSPATNKAVSWWSDNTGVATVNSSGNVTGVGSGTANIYAIAKDGSGVMGHSTVSVYSFTKEDAKWVAHRGLHDYYKENTANAFRAAANKYEIWGIECDIWETMHVRPEVELPKKPADYENVAGQSVEDNNDVAVTAAEDEDLDRQPDDADNIGEDSDPMIVSTQGDVEQDSSAVAVAGEIQGLEIGSMTDDEILDNASLIKTTKEKYNNLGPAQKYEVRSILGDDNLQEFLDAVADISEYESFDIVINHDATFQRVFGVDPGFIWNLTNKDIRNHPTLGKKVCFLKEFVQICKNSGKVPVIEIKYNTDHGVYMSKDAVRKTVDTVYEIGGASLLKQTNFISFIPGSLDLVEDYTERRYNIDAHTVYLISKDGSSKVSYAAGKYNAVAVTLSLMNDNLYNQAKGSGLGIGTWTYKNNSTGHKALKNHVLSGKYALEYATIDYDIFH